MTAETIGQATEYLEHAEHAPTGRHRIAATVAIAVITLLTALTALLAASANWKTSVAQRQRALDTEQAAATLAQVQKQASDLDDEGLLVTQAYARLIAGDGPPRALSETYKALRHQAMQQNDLPTRVLPAIVAQERGSRDAHLADGWLSREEADVGLAGFFAVDLFLVGVALTMRRHRNRWLLLWTACGLAVVGVVRLVIVNVGDPHAVSRVAIRDYAEGQAADDDATAMKWFLHAVRADPSYAAAWVGLAGSMSALDSPRAYLPTAIQAYRNAVRLGDHSQATLNNLAYVELLSGQLGSARTHIDAALTEVDRPDDLDVYTRATHAEVALAGGDAVAALRDRGLIIDALSRDDSFLRDDVFSGLRVDEAQMLAGHVVARELAESFFAPLRTAEAKLDAFPRLAPSVAPAPLATAAAVSLSHDKGTDELVIRIDSPSVTSQDTVSVRLYDAASQQFVRTASVLAAAGGPHLVLRVPVYPNVDYVVETYVDAQPASVSRWPTG